MAQMTPINEFCTWFWLHEKKIIIELPDALPSPKITVHTWTAPHFIGFNLHGDRRWFSASQTGRPVNFSLLLAAILLLLFAISNFKHSDESICSRRSSPDQIGGGTCTTCNHYFPTPGTCCCAWRARFPSAAGFGLTAGIWTLRIFAGQHRDVYHRDEGRGWRPKQTK